MHLVDGCQGPVRKAMGTRDIRTETRDHVRNRRRRGDQHFDFFPGHQIGVAGKQEDANAEWRRSTGHYRSIAGAGGWLKVGGSCDREREPKREVDLEETTRAGGFPGPASKVEWPL